MIKNWCKDAYISLKSLYLVFGRHYRYSVSIKTCFLLFMQSCLKGWIPSGESSPNLYRSKTFSGSNNSNKAPSHFCKGALLCTLGMSII